VATEAFKCTEQAVAWRKSVHLAQRLSIVAPGSGVCPFGGHRRPELLAEKVTAFRGQHESLSEVTWENGGNYVLARDF
jgi:hypothetical protein